MNRSEVQYQLIITELNNLNFSKAEKLLDDWQAKNTSQTAELRCIEHLKAVRDIYQGNVEKALKTILRAQDMYGENIQLTTDLACCYYQLGQWSLWRSSYRKMESVICDEQIQLSDLKKLEAQLMIGKFYEEEGNLCKANKLYLACLDFIPNENVRLKMRVYIQVLRLESTFGSKESIGKYYSELIQMQQQDKTVDFEIELEHCLMLSELNLVGPAHASVRLLRVLDNEMVPDADKALLLYDFLEESLINKLKISESTKQRCLQVTPKDHFEEIILTLCMHGRSQLDLNELMSLSSLLSPASYLRVLTLSLKVLPEQGVEIKNKIHLLLSSIEAASRHLWVRRVDTYNDSLSKTLTFDLNQRMIQFENKSIDLSRKRGMLIFAESIAQNRELSVEDLIARIWDSEYSPDHFHRLRMTAHRMNQLLFDLTSIEKPIEVNADSIKLRPDIQFECIGL